MKSFKEYWNEHGDVYAMEIAEDAWDYQQSKIDELNCDINVQKEQLNKLDRVIDSYAIEVDELQKRLDAALKLIPSLKSENDLWGCEQVERQIELLEQALKGGSDEIQNR